MNHNRMFFPIMSSLFLVHVISNINKSARAVIINGARPMSIYATQQQSGKWSAMSIQTAEEMTTSHRQQLEKDGVTMSHVAIRRPVKVIGKRPDHNHHLNDDDEEEKEKKKKTKISNNDTKILHFQRHGQGFHNTICAIWRELTGSPVDLESKDPTQNPMLRQDVLDSPLTQVGRLQCLACRDEASLLNPQLVVVSPLLRAIQSAEISWSAHRSSSSSSSAIPWIVHEQCREDLGLLVCNQRRTRDELQAMYPDIDFSLCQTNEDTMFLPDRQETAMEKTERVYDFLQYIRALPQTEIAVVGHSAWLFHMCNVVMEIEDPSLKSWFLTSEIRSMQVTFEERLG
jgi:glucosyl-3-phosphoglycerate phosphatase